jgi:hypothetical protein
MSAFSFDTVGAKEKAWQNENAKGAFRALRSATKGSAFGYRDLLKKVDQNFSNGKQALVKKHAQPRLSARLSSCPQVFPA